MMAASTQTWQALHAVWCAASAARPSLATTWVARLDDAAEAGVGRGTRDAPPFGDRLAGDLLDVGGEGDGRRGADRHAHAVGVDRRVCRLEVPDPLHVEPTGNVDPDLLMSGQVEPRADLLDELDGDLAALSWRVEPH